MEQMNVLIVDDDMATVDVIRDCVPWGKLLVTDVKTAYHAAGAKQILKEQQIDIIISDIEMPQETGLDLLEWVRKEQLDCEFLLLTCHEDFAYAKSALHYQAAAYLTKPFDLSIMVMNLSAIIDKRLKDRKQKQNSEYGCWMEKNQKLLSLEFWKQVLDGELFKEDKIKEEITGRHLNVDEKTPYVLVYARINGIEADILRYGREMLEFTLEGFCSEILTGKIENESVVKFYTKDAICLISVCEGKTMAQLKDDGEIFLKTCGVYFKSTPTLCISRPCEMQALAPARQRAEELLRDQISYFGRVFLEQDISLGEEQKAQIIDVEQFVRFVEEKNKSGILRYLKHLFLELSACRNLNLHSLYLMKQEIIQVVFADLMKQGILATRLFYDDISRKMEERAVDSTVDMVRYVNFLLEKTFSYEEEVAKSATIIDKINLYIQEHYTEDISRSEVAAEFYLTPEYLAKMYKRKTGVNLKDYIHACRIDRAKELLQKEEDSVSDIACKVGFDNFSYFSTLFKKSTGMPPKEYRDLKRKEKALFLKETSSSNW